jgi:nitroimidazol reductase NimA-like FMN-containing flavoprotein (pyridoxamine 5'-phosphate oxidase superfamily)
MAIDRHGSYVIDEDECRTLLKLAGASGRVGRLAMNRAGSPFVIPVNYSVCDEMILIRLRPGFAAHHLDGTTVTFEIDHAEPYSKKGWSVEVEGPARLMTNEEVARLGSNLPRPLVMYPGMRVFSIRPDRISGRSIRHDHEGVGPAPSTYWPDRYHESTLPSSPELDGNSEGNKTVPNDHELKGEHIMELQLDDAQVSELNSLLTQAIGELSSEIADTDNPSFKRTLRERRHQLQTVQLQLSSDHAH